jgi:hypothetical protein
MLINLYGKSILTFIKYRYFIFQTGADGTLFNFTRSSLNVYYYHAFEYCVVVLPDSKTKNNDTVHAPAYILPKGQICWLARYVHKKDDYLSFSVPGCRDNNRQNKRFVTIVLPHLKVVSIRVTTAGDLFRTAPQTLNFDFTKMDLPRKAIFYTCAPFPPPPATGDLSTVCFEQDGMFWAGGATALTHPEFLRFSGAHQHVQYCSADNGSRIFYGEFEPGGPVELLQNSIYIDVKLQGIFKHCPVDFVTSLESLLLKILARYLEVMSKKNPGVEYSEFGPISDSILSITYPILGEFGILDSRKVDYFINKVGYTPLNRRVNPKSFLGDKRNYYVDSLPEIPDSWVIERLEEFVAEVIVPEISAKGDVTSFVKKDRKLLLQNITLTIKHALFLCVELETKGYARFRIFLFFFCCFLLFWFVCCFLCSYYIKGLQS